MTRLAIILLLCLAIAGCGDTRERDQAVADAAATIYEAALAIELGAPSALALPAIKANALAIVTATGHAWPPSK